MDTRPIPFPSIGKWLHFIMAKTDWPMVANSIKPDDDRSVLSGNNRTEDGGTSLILKIPINCSSVNPGGVLKKCKIWKKYFY